MVATAAAAAVAAAVAPSSSLAATVRDTDAINSSKQAPILSAFPMLAADALTMLAMTNEAPAAQVMDFDSSGRLDHPVNDEDVGEGRVFDDDAAFAVFARGCLGSLQ